MNPDTLFAFDVGQRCLVFQMGDKLIGLHVDKLVEAGWQPAPVGRLEDALRKCLPRVGQPTIQGVSNEAQAIAFARALNGQRRR